MSAQVFRGLARSSSTTLEAWAAESGALLPFLGGSRPLLHDSGEKSRGPTFFRRAPARCFCNKGIISKRAKSVKNHLNPLKVLVSEAASLQHLSSEFGALLRVELAIAAMFAL